MKKLASLSTITLAVLISAGNLCNVAAQEARRVIKPVEQQKHKLHRINEAALRRASEKAGQIREQSRKTDARPRPAKSITRERMRPDQR